MTREFVVGSADDGMRIDTALAKLLDVSRSQAAVLVEDGRVTVDGNPVAKGYRLKPGERIAVQAAPSAPVAEVPAAPPIRYQDEHLVVVAKPPGLVVHPGHGRPDGTLVDALRGAGVALEGGDPARPGIVHRLDRDTSGLLVVASSAEAYEGLVAALAARQVTRRYVALVAGVPDASRGRVEAPIGRDPRDRTRFAVVTGGRDAVTRYVVHGSGSAPGLGTAGAVSVLRCRLETGRTHQLRVHLTTLGHPLVADPVYGPRPALGSALGLTRPALHAGRLAFIHPVTGVEVVVDEPVPDDLAGAIRSAGIEVPDLSVEDVDGV